MSAVQNQIKNLVLKDSNLVPLFVSDVFVDGEDEHEHKEEAGTAKDVPDVVPVINRAGKLEFWG